MLHWMALTWKENNGSVLILLRSSNLNNPLRVFGLLNANIKIHIPLSFYVHFLQERWKEVFKYSRVFICSDHVL